MGTWYRIPGRNVGMLRFAPSTSDHCLEYYVWHILRVERDSECPKFGNPNDERRNRIPGTMGDGTEGVY